MIDVKLMDIFLYIYNILNFNESMLCIKSRISIEMNILLFHSVKFDENSFKRFNARLLNYKFFGNYWLAYVAPQDYDNDVNSQ